LNLTWPELRVSGLHLETLTHVANNLDFVT